MDSSRSHRLIHIINNCEGCAQGRLKGGANRAIARGSKCWVAHELFEKFFFTIYMKKKMS